jgi:hypothetical protein
MQSLFGLAKVTSRRTAALLRAAGIETQTVMTAPAGSAVPTNETYAPAWAVAIADEPGIGDRDRMTALRRAAADKDAQLWVSPLLGILTENADRVRAIVDVAKDAEKTLVCRCGAKFTSALAWREHVEDACPKRAGAE